MYHIYIYICIIYIYVALNVNPKKWFDEIHFVHANHAKELLEMLLGEAGWWVFTHQMYVLMKFKWNIFGRVKQP